jgi:hypothetical protein
VHDERVAMEPPDGDAIADDVIAAHATTVYALLG